MKLTVTEQMRPLAITPQDTLGGRVLPGPTALGSAQMEVLVPRGGTLSRAHHLTLVYDLPVTPAMPSPTSHPPQLTW